MSCCKDPPSPPPATTDNDHNSSSHMPRPALSYQQPLAPSPEHSRHRPEQARPRLPQPATTRLAPPPNMTDNDHSSSSHVPQTRPELPPATSPESRTQLQHPAAQQTEAPLPYSLSPPFPLSLLPVCPCIRPLSENKAEESGPRDPVFVAGSLPCSFALQKSPSFPTHLPPPLPALVSPSFAKGTAYA